MYFSQESVVFLIFNCFLPFVDMATDLVTFFMLVTYHPKWAAITLMWMFVPFIIHAIRLIYLSSRCKTDFKTKQFFYHLPFILPIYNFFLLGEMIENKRLLEDSKAEAIVKNGKILSKVGDSSLFESFCEAGPQ